MTGIVTIDLRTRYVPQSRRIWRLFPGRRYNFLSEFLSTSLVFLDTPGLILPDGPVIADDHQINKRIEAYAAIRNWAYENERSARQGRLGSGSPEPSRDIATYKGFIGQKLQTQKAAIIGMFERANIGDLVVIPNVLSSRELMVGEFLEEPSVRTTTSISMYGREEIPARRIRWFPSIDEGSLPPQFTKSLRTSNPFTGVGRNYYDALFARTYGTYYRDEEFVAEITVSGDDFGPISGINLNLLTLLVAAACSETVDASFYADQNLFSIATGNIPNDFIPSFSYDIQSPGSIHVRSSTVVPIVLAALLSLLAAVPASAQGSPPPKNPVVTNSANPHMNDPCLPRVHNGVKRSLEMMGMKVWQDACYKAEQLRKEPKISTDPVAVVSP